jgi:hypothetical protein
MASSTSRACTIDAGGVTCRQAIPSIPRHGNAPDRGRQLAISIAQSHVRTSCARSECYPMNALQIMARNSSCLQLLMALRGAFSQALDSSPSSQTVSMPCHHAPAQSHYQTNSSSRRRARSCCQFGRKHRCSSKLRLKLATAVGHSLLGARPVGRLHRHQKDREC